MLKTAIVTLALTAACATPDKPAANGGDAMPASQQPETSKNAAVTASKDGTKIAFEKVGKGPALIIVGGALSQRDGGKPLAGKLAEHFTVYVYDRRGRGESGDTQPYAVEREIEDLNALIDQAGGDAYAAEMATANLTRGALARRLGVSRAWVIKALRHRPPSQGSEATG